MPHGPRRPHLHEPCKIRAAEKIVEKNVKNQAFATYAPTVDKGEVVSSILLGSTRYTPDRNNLVAPASSARARRDPGVRKDAGRRPATSRTSPHVHPLWPQRNRQCKRAHCALAASIFTGCADECLRPAVVVLQSVRNPNLRMGPFENSTCLLAMLPPSPPHTRSAASARLRR